MSIEQQKYELIEKYLRGELTGSALHAFEAQMRQNPIFAEEVQLHRDIEAALLDEDAINLRRTLQKINAEEKDVTAVDDRRATLRTRTIKETAPSTKVRSLPRPLRTVAAMLVLGLCVGLLWMILNNSNQTQQMKTDEIAVIKDTVIENKEGHLDKGTEKIVDNSASSPTTHKTGVDHTSKMPAGTSMGMVAEKQTMVVNEQILSSLLATPTIDPTFKAYLQQLLDSLKQENLQTIEFSNIDYITLKKNFPALMQQVATLTSEVQQMMTTGWAILERDGLKGYMDQYKTEVIPPIYEEIGFFSDGLAKVKKNGKWGFVNPMGIVVIPIQYTTAGDFMNQQAKVSLGGETYFIDGEGNSKRP